MTEYEFGWCVFITLCVIITYVSLTIDLIEEAKKNRKNKK